MLRVSDTSLSFDHDVVVLGAGAAGLLAAARAAECGARVLLTEKNRRPGVKILMSGGTRCNITSARGLRRLDVVSGPIDPAYDPEESCGIRAIQQAFGDSGAFLVPALKRFDVDATVRLFEDAGVPTKIELSGKVFPVSDRAADVLGALVQKLERSGAVLRCLSPVLAIDPRESEPGASSGFAVRLPEETILAQSDRRGGRLILPGMRYLRRWLCDRAEIWPSRCRSTARPGSAPGWARVDIGPEGFECGRRSCLSVFER